MTIHYTNRFLAPTQSSFFLFGPRGTGKSTWLKTQYPQALFINLLNANVLMSLQSDPERLIELIEASNSKTIIIDEIQKAPELLSLVHSLIEEHPNWQFILTGSSARKLKRAGVDLLAGRAIVKYLHPFMAAELSTQFSLSQTLSYGLVPLITNSQNIQDVLDSYIGLYMEEEVKAEGLVRNIHVFARFLEVMAFSHASVLNVTNIARECQTSRSLIEGYLGVLEDLLLAFQLPVFTKRAQRATIQHSKFYYFDVGVYKNLRTRGFLDNEKEINGPGLEGLIAQHLRAWSDYRQDHFKLFYWRTRTGIEVDFIIYGKSIFYAIEVKSTQVILPKDLRGLKAFSEEYPEASLLLVYSGRERLKKGNILCLPIEDFLLQLTPERQTII